MWLHRVNVGDSDVLLLLLFSTYSSRGGGSSSNSSSSGGGSSSSSSSSGDGGGGGGSNSSSSSSSSGIIFPIRVGDYFFLPKGVSQPSTEWVTRNVPEGKAVGIWRLPLICI